MWHIEYYQSDSGRSPVAEFIEAQETKSRARIARTLDLLEEFGIRLGMPYAKYLGEQLWELRIKHRRNQYRVIYFLAAEREFVLLHALAKKTDAVPRRDIDLAKHRKDVYVSRQKRQ